MYNEYKYAPNVGNYSKRWNTCEGVVWHHSADSFESAWSVSMGMARQKDGSPLRAGYNCIIALDGERHVFVEDRKVAYHAGVSEWQGKTGCNSRTIGVAFTGDTGKRTLTPAEIASALEWLEPRWTEYGWTMDSMTTHRAVCRPVGRKVDISTGAEAQLFNAIRKRYANK